VFFSAFPKSSLECKFLELNFGLFTSGLCLILQLVAALRSQVSDLQLCELRALDCKFMEKNSLDVCVCSFLSVVQDSDFAVLLMMHSWVSQVLGA
jgi:hypothetical protein